MADEKKKQRRINATSYWGLKKKMKELEAKQKEFRDWSEKEAEKMGLYADCVNFRSGVVTKVVGMQPSPDGRGQQDLREFVKRLDLTEPAVIEAKKKMVVIEEAGNKAEKYLDNIAEKYGLTPDLIDLKTGRILDEDIDFVEPSEKPDKVAGTIPTAPDEEAAPDAQDETEKATD